MRIRLTKAVVTLLLLIIPPVGRVAAQVPQAKPSLPTFEVIKKVGTPDEEPLVQSVIKNLQAKFGDASFSKQIDDAWATKNLARVRTLIAGATQQKADQLRIAYQKSSMSQIPGNASAFRLASYRPSGRAFNPWYLIIVTKSGKYCVELRWTRECEANGYAEM